MWAKVLWAPPPNVWVLTAAKARLSVHHAATAHVPPVPAKDFPHAMQVNEAPEKVQTEVCATLLRPLT